jgi:NAD(P)-dependent dehydrogenase (short-subunit alcohol dehydrogenase family)
MQGKTILITGATDGIGRETARQLAVMDARVIIHGRAAEKAERAQEEIIAETGNEKVETAIADFSAMANVRALADEIASRFDHLDVLVNNAGVYLTEYIQTPDGFETTFAVNHLAPFLLTNLLVPLLKGSTPARIVTVSSVAHGSARVDLDNLNAEKRFHGWGAYCLSKLGNLLFTFELARRLEGSGVAANALHPGTVNTKMLAKLGMRGKSVAEGAETSVFLASSPDVAGVSGKYFSQKRIAKPSEAALDRELQQTFWERSAEMVNLTT